MAVMNLPNIEFFLIMGRAVFLVFSFALAAVTFTAWRRAARRESEQMLEHNQTLLERLAQIAARLDSTDERVSAFGEQLARSTQRLPSAAGASSGYQIAIRLARNGAGAEELVGGCGLTRTEAELIRRLHGPRSPEVLQAS